MNPTRRLLLKILPASLATLLLGKQTSVAAIDTSPKRVEKTPIPRQVLRVDFARTSLIVRTANKIVEWMKDSGYKGRFTVSAGSFPGLYRDVDGHGLSRGSRLAEPAQRVQAMGKPEWWNSLDISEFITVWRETSDDKEACKLLNDLFREMCRPFKFGKPVTNDDVEPDDNMPIRYRSCRYTKDIDYLHGESQQLGYTLGCLLYDMLDVPERPSAYCLELPTLYSRREAFILELQSWTTHLVPQVIETIPFYGNVEEYRYLREAQWQQFHRAPLTKLFADFKAKHGRPPRVIFANNVLIKEFCKWCRIELLGDPHTVGHINSAIRAAFEKEFGCVLQVFTYSKGGDNDTRLIG
jgi:hypothetical protein